MVADEGVRIRTGAAGTTCFRGYPVANCWTPSP